MILSGQFDAGACCLVRTNKWPGDALQPSSGDTDMAGNLTDLTESESDII